MFRGKRILAVIPARGGSKTVPGKNIKCLAGKPLIAWSIETAKSVEELDRVIVSTDDDAIGAVALEHGAEVYLRPESLATDQALVIDTLRDLIGTLKNEGEIAEILVLLEPTCPFRAATDVRDCIARLVLEGFDSAATFKAAELNPLRAWAIADGSPSPFLPGADPWQPRQKLPPAYQLNGAVYAFHVDRLPVNSPALLFGRSGAVVMPPERSVDIDREIDFLTAEAILRSRR
jgi:N-acylneuraminate cytidylyltransferase